MTGQYWKHYDPVRENPDEADDPKAWSPCKQHRLGYRYTYDYHTVKGEDGHEYPVCIVCGERIEL